MHAMGYGYGGILLLLLWLIGAAILFGVVYAAVRLGVLHALKSHTMWLQGGGQPGAAPPAVRPAPPASPAPPAGPSASAAPPAPPTPPQV